MSHAYYHLNVLVAFVSSGKHCSKRGKCHKYFSLFRTYTYLTPTIEEVVAAPLIREQHGSIFGPPALIQHQIKALLAHAIVSGAPKHKDGGIDTHLLTGLDLVDPAMSHSVVG